jgi:hypothetical protein
MEKTARFCEIFGDYSELLPIRQVAATSKKVGNLRKEIFG